MKGGSGFDQKLDLRGLLFDLNTHRRRAVGAEVFVLVSLREDQKQFFSNGNGSFTSRTIKGGCFELIKTWRPHTPIIIDADGRDNTSDDLS